MLEERPHLVATSTAEGACTARAIAALVRDPAVRGPDRLKPSALGYRYG